LAELYIEKEYKVGVTGIKLNLPMEINQLYPEQTEYECFNRTMNENVSRLESLKNKLGGFDILITSAQAGENHPKNLTGE
jgi:hypothetical protein